MLKLRDLGVRVHLLDLNKTRLETQIVSRYTSYTQRLQALTGLMNQRGQT